MVDLSSYVPPGVYVEDISQDLVTSLAPGVPENLLCIVAQALGYQTVTERINVYSLLDTALSNPGVIQDATLVVTTLTGTVLVLDTDYSVGTTSVGDVDTTTITRLPIDPEVASPGGVVDGQSVSVTYNFTDATYYTPQRYSDYSSLSAVYGPALSSVLGAVDPVISPLSLAAKVAFENGAGEIIALPVQHVGANTVQQDFAAAYTQLATEHRVSVLVVVIPELQSDTGAEMISYATDLKAHCDAAAANGFGREVLIGAAAAFDESAFAFEDIATTVANKRIVVVYPYKFTIANAQTSAMVEVGGGYAAAACGGRLVFNDVEQSLTRQVIRSFDSIPASVRQQMTLAFKNNLSANGVLVIETDRLDRLVVRHAVTTDVSALNTREISMVRISDVLSQDIQVGLDTSGLIGAPIDEEVTVRVKGVLTGLLEQAVASNVIVAYANLLVRQQALPNGDPSVIECQFAYRPAVPLNYITVKFSLNMSTGVLVDSSLDLLA